MAALGATALVLGNLTTVSTFWKADVAPFFAKRAQMQIQLASPPDRSLRLVISPPDDREAALVTRDIRGGESTAVELPIGAAWEVSWYGYRFEPGKTATAIRLAEGQNSWRLVTVRTSPDGLEQLQLRSDFGRPVQTQSIDAHLVIGAGPENSRNVDKLMRLLHTGSPDPHPGPEGQRFESALSNARQLARPTMAMCGLSSPRAEVFIIDRIVGMGSGNVRAAAEACEDNADFSHFDEREKVLWLREKLLEGFPPRMQDLVRRRADVILTGEGSIAGVTFAFPE